MAATLRLSRWMSRWSICRCISRTRFITTLRVAGRSSASALAVRLARGWIAILTGGITISLFGVVDRARELELGESKTHESDLSDLGERLSTLEVRARLLGRAIALCTICALLVSMVVVALFLGALLNFRLAL